MQHRSHCRLIVCCAIVCTHINVWLDKFSPPNLSPIYTRQFYILYIHISLNIIFSKSSCTFFLSFFFARLLLFLLYYLIFLLLVRATERPTTQFNHLLLLIVIIIVMDRQYSQCTYITYMNEKKHRNMKERTDMWRAQNENVHMCDIYGVFHISTSWLQSGMGKFFFYSFWKIYFIHKYVRYNSRSPRIRYSNFHPTTHSLYIYSHHT